MNVDMFLDEHLHWEVGATLPPDSTGNVPSSFSYREKGGRMNDLLRLLAWPSTFRPAGGCLCHPTSLALYQ